MRRISIVVAALAGAAFPALAGELDGPGIAALLEGNSIIHPDFGCVWYRDARSSVSYVGDQEIVGQWSVRGDLYHSSGQCGEIGCQLAGEGDSYVFIRTDGQYRQPVLVIKGNYCRKDGIIS